MRSSLAALACWSSVAGAAGPNARAEPKQYFVYDGLQYRGDQLEQASRSPVPVTAPHVTVEGEYVVRRSPDGHFYLPGSVNGFSVVWLVDTGASHSTLPAPLAANAGIRAGLSITIETVAGTTTAAITNNNDLEAGPYRLPQSQMIISRDLHMPLLGADALSRFNVSTANGALVLTPSR